MDNRYFTALSIPADIKKQIYEWHKPIRERFSFRKWVFEQDYHITLKYLGACDENQISQVRDRLAKLSANNQLFTLQLSDIGYFGRADAPRIFWAGVQGDLSSLHRLQATVEQAMEEVGFPRENRPYRPHVTLAKNYTGSKFDLATASTLWRDLALESWEVSSVVLYRTELGRQPMYVVEGEYSFQT